MATMLKQWPSAICRSVAAIYHRYMSKPRPKCGETDHCQTPNDQTKKRAIIEITALPAGFQITEEEQRKIDEVLKELDRVIQENDD
ncbi:uncharacterized protein DMAD_02094 [Drosophila madeirensis]|uniref:Uncharacterized protein n=1 Tax=Drosophila madeirensis TaxID=30013 RepID=A0AAU9G416_DROMD